MIHTPGPWRVLTTDEDEVYVETDQTLGNNCSAIICQVGHVSMSKMSEPERHRADARLIASAPVLLESLRQVIEHALDEHYAQTDPDGVLADAIEVIRKATETGASV